MTVFLRAFALYLSVAALLSVAACASHRDETSWGALSQQVGRQINSAPHP